MPGADPPTKPPLGNAIWLSRLPRWLLLSAAAFGLLFIPAGILELSLPDRYLPSTEWLRVSRPAVYALWIIWGLSVLFVVGLSDASGTKRVFVAVGSIALFSSPVGNLVRSNIPALLALMSGGEVEHAYIVVRADRRSDKWCRTPVELEGMPFMTKLCGVSDEFRAHLSPGQTVVFGGSGTWMGLYVEYMLQP